MKQVELFEFIIRYLLTINNQGTNKKWIIDLDHKFGSSLLFGNISKYFITQVHEFTFFSFLFN